MIGLDAILIKYFGNGFEREESPSCDSYEKLINLIEELGALGVITDNANIIRELDKISSENALFDENGEMIYDATKIDERKAYLTLVEDSYEIYKNNWCEERGYDIAQIDEEYGINGECYVCLSEFETNEFQYEDYMSGILDEEDYVKWNKIFESKTKG